MRVFMCQVLVIYASRTGNTKVMADAVVKGVQSVQRVEVISHQIGDPFAVSVLRDAEALVALGYPAETPRPVWKKPLDAIVHYDKF